MTSRISMMATEKKSCTGRPVQFFFARQKRSKAKSRKPRRLSAYARQDRVSAEAFHREALW